MRYLILMLMAVPAYAQAPERAIPLWVVNKHLMVLEARHNAELEQMARERDEALRHLYNVEQRVCS